MAKKAPVLPPLQEFVEDYMPNKYPLNWHHKLFYGVLDNLIIQNPETKLLTMNKTEKVNKSILMFAPRGHAKSTCVTIQYPVWELYKNPNIRILVVSANQEIATGFVRAIMWQLENNNILKDTYGDLVPFSKRKWGERAFIINRETKEKDPSVVGIGVGGKLISRRADLIIIDDLLDIETARTKVQRRKTKEWYENVLLPILEEGGRLVFVGTAWYKNDLLDELFTEGQFDVKIKLKALVYNSKIHLAPPGSNMPGNDTKAHWLPYKLNDWPRALDIQTIMDQSVTRSYEIADAVSHAGTLWPAVWPYDKLLEKKNSQNMSDAAFSRQYLNEPMAETDRIFKEVHIKTAQAKGQNKSLTEKYNNADPPYNLGYGHVVTATGLDLAISRKATADDSALATWALTERKEFVPLWLDAGKWTTDETKHKVAENFSNFSPVKIKVENVAFQDMMVQELQNNDLHVEGFATTSSRKFNEETGIARIAMLFEQGRIILPSATKNSDHWRMVNRLKNELLDYSYDSHAGDLLMASWFAIDCLYDFDKKMMENRGFFSNAGLVEQMKMTRAASKILILAAKPPVYKFLYSSFVHVFRPISKEGEEFFTEAERFYIFATKKERGCAYVFEKATLELICKVEGNTSALMFAQLLEKAGRFFNNAQVIVDKNDEGNAVIMELGKRFYPNLVGLQPDENGLPTVKDGFKITEASLPIAVDSLRVKIADIDVALKDDSLIKEMGDVIDINGNEIKTSHGEAQRLKTFAVGLWLLENYERTSQKLYNKNSNVKIKKELNVPYRIFR